MAMSAAEVAEMFGQSLTIAIPSGVDLASARVRVQLHLRDGAVFAAIANDHGAAVQSFDGSGTAGRAFVSATFELGGVAVTIFHVPGQAESRPTVGVEVHA